MNIFNNREIATGIWLFVVFIFIITQKNIRSSLLNVIRAFFKIKILTLIFLMIAYSTGIVIILYLLKIWDISLLKDSIIWLCFSGVIISFNAITSTGDKNLLKNIIIDNIKMVVIIEFIVNVYTFPLLVELFLIPFVTLIILLEIVAKLNKEYSSVTKLINGSQAIIGVSILVYAIINIVSNYNNFENLDTLRNFLLAPLLTTLFIPFIYFTVLSSTYELLFIRLDFGYEKNKKLKRYAKRKIIRYCLLSLKKIKKISNMETYNLMHVKSIEDVNEMIKAYKEQL